MTPKRIAEAQARLDALPRKRDDSGVDGDHALFLVLNHMDEGGIGDALTRSPQDLDDALAALRRVRVVQRYDVSQDGSGPFAAALVEADPEGDWVRWSELRAALDGEPG